MTRSRPFDDEDVSRVRRSGGRAARVWLSDRREPPERSRPRRLPLIRGRARPGVRVPSVLRAVWRADPAGCRSQLRALSPPPERLAWIAGEMADEMQLPVPPDECLDDAQDQEFWRRFEARVAEEQARGPASRARRATNALVFLREEERGERSHDREALRPVVSRSKRLILCHCFEVSYRIGNGSRLGPALFRVAAQELSEVGSRLSR